MAVAVPERTWAAHIALGDGVFPGSVRSRGGSLHAAGEPLRAALLGRSPVWACRRHHASGIPCLLRSGAAVRNGLAAFSADRARNLQRLWRFPCRQASNRCLSRRRREVHRRAGHQRGVPALCVAVSGGCRDDLGARNGNRVLRCAPFVDCTLALTRWVGLCIALSSVHVELGQRC